MVSASISRLTNNSSKSLLLYGVPGTEKVKIALHATCSILNTDISQLMRHHYDPVGISSDNGCWELLSIHPGYDYSNFIGVKRDKSPGITNNNFNRGIFSLICKKATEMRDLHDRYGNPRNFVLILDGIEKVNLPEIFGELLPALNLRDIAIPTMITRSIAVPDNLYIIAIANVASLRMLPQFCDIARHFSPVNVISDISRIPHLLSGYNIPDKDISSYIEKCQQLNDTISKLISDSIHIENISIGQEFLAKITNYMSLPDSSKKVINTIKPEMLQTMWNDIIDPLIFQMLGNAYFRTIAKLEEVKSNFIKA